MRKVFVLVLLVGWLAVGTAFGEGYRGTYVMKSEGLTLVLNEDASGRITGTLSGADGTRRGLEGTVEEGIASGMITGGSGQSLFEAEFEGAVLVFTLIEADSNGEVASRSLEFVRSSEGGQTKIPEVSPPAAAGTAPKPPASPPPVAPSPPAASEGASALMSYFSGSYYSYSSGSTIYGSAGTERTVTLCPDGRYLDTYEFSASGSAGDPVWGGVNSQSGAARWTVQGDKTQGVILVTYPDGRTRRIPFQVISKDEGAILFDGIKFAYAGAPKCP
jgi:hypothetical protein